MTMDGSNQNKQAGEMYRGMKAAVYTRNSTARSRHAGVLQFDAIRQFAAAEGIGVLEDHVYEDEAPGVSGVGRADHQKLLASVRSGKPPFQLILVYDKTRWTRNAEDIRADERTLKRSGIRLVSVTDVAAGHDPL